MDIANISMGLAQSKLLSDVGTAMLSKTLNMSQNIGASVADMLDSIPGSNVTVSKNAMELSVNPDIGANIDILC